MFDGILFTITKIENYCILHGLFLETLARDSKGIKKGERHTYNKAVGFSNYSHNLEPQHVYYIQHRRRSLLVLVGGGLHR